MLINMMLR